MCQWQRSRTVTPFGYAQGDVALIYWYKIKTAS
jgi:hypothetical protein